MNQRLVRPGRVDGRDERHARGRRAFRGEDGDRGLAAYGPTGHNGAGSCAGAVQWSDEVLRIAIEIAIFWGNIPLKMQKEWRIAPEKR